MTRRGRADFDGCEVDLAGSTDFSLAQNVQINLGIWKKLFVHPDEEHGDLQVAL